MQERPDNAQNGRMAIQLGPVERWVVALAASMLVGGVIWAANDITARQDGNAKAVNARLDKLAEQQNTQTLTQAVMTQQLATLTVQLADVPTLSRQIAELSRQVGENHVQIGQNTADIHQLQERRR